MGNPNHERARELEHAALVGLGLIGWMKTAQVGAWVWPDSDPKTSAALARRLLPRLEKTDLVKRRTSATGINAWVLTKLGAAQASSRSKWTFHHGYDLGMLDSYKQEKVVEFLTVQRRLGKAAIGAAGIRAGVAGTEHLKGLDGVAIDPDNGRMLGILVVRSAHQNTVEHALKMRQRVKLLLVGEAGIVRQLRKRGV